jgi:hypothetical protein
MRFFTFPEIQTDTVSLVTSGQNSVKSLDMSPGCDYFLSKEQTVQTITGRIERRQGESSSIDKNALQVVFEIDQSNSKVRNEHMMLA